MIKNFLLPLILVLLAVVAPPVSATVTEVGLDELNPTREQRQATLIILRVIDRYHYRHVQLNDELSNRVFDRYLEALDPNRSYFTNRDLERFAPWRNSLDNALLQARLEPAFEIFRVYRQRVDERIAYALDLLNRGFDFSVDESYLFDRSKAPWASDRVALDEIWRKRVKNDFLGLRLSDKSDDEIKETLIKRYQGVQRRTHQLGSDDVFQTFVNAYTLSLEPHTSYMSPRVSENFDISMRLSLEGIGAVLRSENEYTEVLRTVTGGPAALSGKVQAGDRIVGVGQGDSGEMQDVIGWRLQDVVDKIRGPKGSVVRLRLLSKDAGPGDPTQDVVLVRNEIKLEDQAAKRSIVEGLDSMGPVRIGVIDIPAFYRDFRGHSEGDDDFRSTTRDVRELLRELQVEGVDGIVVDLRGNGGGSLIEATELTGLFIADGPVVQVKDARGEVEVEKDPDPELVYAGPLAVLVDRNSASASEIFAGAIQDYQRGIIIGEPTFGKGTVQTLVDLGRFVREGGDQLGRLRLTMAQFFRVNGGSTQFRGVVPDIIYPTASAAEDHGERGLENALPWAQIKAADFHPSGLAAFSGCRESHERRIMSDEGFKYLQGESQLLQELRDNKEVSLLESQRKQEWEQREAKRKSHKQRFRVAIGLPAVEDNDSENNDSDDGTGEDDKLVNLIQVNEAARILADYIEGQRRQVMVH
ncbi:MAG: carboxy terminal-processing peptidase [Gammaproteobacteria bacterium]|nr:carboxy terminal-processing peptidase [Gammaproteobacteria bacterium]